MRVAVVGAGIMGSCCAWRLARAGHEVTVFDQFEAGHRQGSSHGWQKIVRRAYPDRFHTSLLRQAHDCWQELERESGRTVVHPCGLLYIGPRGPGLDAMRSCLDECGVPWSSREDVPAPMRLAAGEEAVFTAEAGWADTEAALAAARALALGLEARFLHHKVEALVELAGYDRVVVAAGAWASRLVPLKFRVTLQTSAYFEARYEGPVWIEGFGAELYGFPNAAGEPAFKVGYHAPGPETDPDDRRRDPDPAQVEALVELARRRFGIADPAPLRCFGCLYASTDDSLFRIGWSDPRTIVVSACSGHGYKFAPWVGRLVARMLDGVEEPPGEFALR